MMLSNKSHFIVPGCLGASSSSQGESVFVIADIRQNEVLQLIRGLLIGGRRLQQQEGTHVKRTSLRCSDMPTEQFALHGAGSPRRAPQLILEASSATFGGGGGPRWKTAHATAVRAGSAGTDSSWTAGGSPTKTTAGRQRENCVNLPPPGARTHRPRCGTHSVRALPCQGPISPPVHRNMRVAAAHEASPPYLNTGRRQKPATTPCHACHVM